MALSNPAVRNAALMEANIAVMRVKNGRSAKGLLLLSRHRAARIKQIDRIREVLSAVDVHIVRVTSSKDRSLLAVLGSQLYDALQRMAGNDVDHAPNGEALDVLVKFSRCLKSQYPYIDFAPEPGIADSGVLESDLASLLEAIGASASQAGTAYAVLIDDMHCLGAEQLSALIGALHRIAQCGLPIVLIGAGSSKLRRQIGFAKPYAERMFDFIDLDAR